MSKDSDEPNGDDSQSQLHDFRASSMSFRNASFRSSFYSVASSFQRSNSSNEWTCAACSYHNAGYDNLICSVCGTNRNNVISRSFRLSSLPLTRSSPGEAGGAAISESVEKSSSKMNPKKPGTKKSKFVANKHADFLDSPPDLDNKVRSRPSETLNSDSAPVGLKPERKAKSKIVTNKHADFLDSPPDLTVMTKSNGNLKSKSESKQGSQENTSSSDNDEAKDKDDSSNCRRTLGSLFKQMSFANWSGTDNQEWVCGLCTYVNEDPLHLTCAICGNARGQRRFSLKEPLLSRGSSEEDQQRFMERQKEQSEQAALELIENERWGEWIQDQFDHLEAIRMENERAIDSCEKETNRLAASTSIGTSIDVQETLRTLEECKMKLTEIDKVLDDEKREQEVMEAVQQQRREIIEQEDGPSAFEDEKLPPLKRKRAIVWTAQQKMLDEWKRHVEKRERRVTLVRQRQNEIGESFRNAKGLPLRKERTKI